MSSIFSMFPLEVIVSASIIILLLAYFKGGTVGVAVTIVAGYLILHPAIVITMLNDFSVGNEYSVSSNTQPRINGMTKIPTKNQDNQVIDNNIDAIYETLMMNAPLMETLRLTGRVFTGNIFGGNIFNTITGGKISADGSLEKLTLKSCFDSNKEASFAISQFYPTDEIPLNVCISDCVVNFIEDKTNVKPFVNDKNELQFVRIGMANTNGTSCSTI